MAGFMFKAKVVLFCALMIGVIWGLLSLNVISAEKLFGIWSANMTMILGIGEVLLFGYFCATANPKGCLVTGAVLLTTLIASGVWS